MSDDAIDRARALVATAGSVTVLTGAGISTDSGIPDFRGPNGVWTKNPGAERTATLSHYLADPDVRRRAWRNRLESPAWSARPNAGHQALVALERTGRLHTLVTQNIDELHQQAGSDPALVVEVHGTVRQVKCMACGDRAPMERSSGWQIFCVRRCRTMPLGGIFRVWGQLHACRRICILEKFPRAVSGTQRSSKRGKDRS